MNRRHFLGTLAAGAAAMTATVVALRTWSRPRIFAERPAYLTRGPDGIWGITFEPRLRQGVLAIHPDGVTGIGAISVEPHRELASSRGMIGVARVEEG